MSVGMDQHSARGLKKDRGSQPATKEEDLNLELGYKEREGLM